VFGTLCTYDALKGTKLSFLWRLRHIPASAGSPELDDRSLTGSNPVLIDFPIAICSSAHMWIGLTPSSANHGNPRHDKMGQRQSSG
jgi:hypothetical protein